MTKLVLPELTGGYLDAALINTAFQQIEDFSDNVVTRDGTAPNAMAAPLDLNSNRIINLADGQEAGDAVTVRQLDGAASGLVRQMVEYQLLPPGTETITFTSLRYTPGANSLALHLDGRRQAPGNQYTETSASTVELPAALGDFTVMLAVTNEYLGTTTVPLTTVLWSQLSGVPSFASRWPTWSEVTDKPALASASHTHWAEEIQLNPTGESLTDGVRGIFVQSSEPTATRVGDLWFW